LHITTSARLKTTKFNQFFILADQEPDRPSRSERDEGIDKERDRERPKPSPENQ